jgi:hypothetical protein
MGCKTYGDKRVLPLSVVQFICEKAAGRLLGNTSGKNGYLSEQTIRLPWKYRQQTTDIFIETIESNWVALRDAS